MNSFIEVKELIDQYNEMMVKSQNIAFFARGIEIQKNEIENLLNYDQYLEKIKKEFISAKKEKAANWIFCLQYGAKAIYHELSMIVYLKEDKMSEAWGNLIEAQHLTEIVIQNHPIDGDDLLGYKSRLHAYEITLFPKMMFSSYGGIVKISECSICGKDYNECDHIKGKLYVGEMCCRIIKEVDLEEISIVENPADKRNRILTNTDKDGNTIDILTLRKQ